ncbi:DNA/RNA non-specific endonuclease [[Synechococcus] sp. NIES-970]|nr:DNA/RNA non-specific endonuclease [[Synechococcus] sp. NIES-970]
MNMITKRIQYILKTRIGRRLAYGLLVGAALLIFRPTEHPAESPSSTATQNPATACPAHLPNGIPQGTPATNDLLVRSIYCLSANPETKFADWVAFRLDRETITGSSNQDREWAADPDLHRDVTLEPEDYRGAYQAHNYDRGHLAPLASFRGGNWYKTNYLSNITPQKADLNRGAWKDLEEYERDLVRRYGEVHTIVGTAYDARDSTSPRKTQLPNADEPHQIPDYFWRIITYNNTTEAYIFSQDTPLGADFRLGKISPRELEQYTGLTFSSE